MISKAAEVAPPPRPEPVTVVPIAAPAPPPPAPAPVAGPAPADQTPSQYAVPAHIAAARQAPDAVHWIMFGSAAAFLFIVLLAIFFGFRW